MTLGLTLFSFTAKALFPESFWRVVQVAERLAFLYGGTANPTEFMSIEQDGRIGIGAIPTNASAILELQSEDKALLVSRVSGISAIATPENGMIVYDQSALCFKVYQTDRWSECIDIAQGIRVLPQEPQGGSIGDVYYNTSNNTLFIHDGNQWIPVTANFLELTAYSFACTRHDLVEPNRQLRCPNNKRITSLFYETATYSPTVDFHSIPEITGVECCSTAYHPFYWDTTAWSACSGGSQSRSVSCKGTNGAAADLSACIASHRPASSQSCEVPVIPAQWQAGNYGACSASGVQTRTVTCVGPGGNELPGQCDASMMPTTSQSCTPPSSGTNITCEGNDTDTGWAYGPTSNPQQGYDGRDGISAPACLAECKDRIQDLVDGGETSTQFTCRRHEAGHCYPVVAGLDRQPRNYLGCNGCQTRFCTIPGGTTTNTGPSDNAQCDATGKFTIPAAEFDSLDGSANSFLRGRNHAYIDWSRCDNQVTAASVDNGGIRINFRNPPRAGRVTFTVNTGHARIYRVAHASNISGNLPGRFSSNRTYVYSCDFNGSSYSCNVR
ncbi:MAG TPA: thrombospondin type-1 domain-containing protein [Candidatus Gracilibacteria bacterium]